ncbi:hypothetical protein [Cupriavidus lacunae]|uniref:Uncharacterized protein n=1 Tax=Cupriavidus lacunae TaxID=2666307 RepID=A0A370NIG6_9BURK|nr:hypothetical protein [Cupriavidus lacunae]RDK05373.1 hypothetical protein DN412_37410 [Cupriavidus lacunae]
MTSWRVEIRHNNSGKTTEIDLVDTVGFDNDWKAVDEFALTPNAGKFTNQTQRVVPVVQPSWILLNFDIDNPPADKRGIGRVDDNSSPATFPEGDITWRIVQEL